MKPYENVNLKECGGYLRQPPQIGFLPAENGPKESRSSAARQLGERNMPAQSLNWHAASRADSL